MAFRTRQELFASILQSVERNGKARITRIMYESFTSYKSVSRNIRELIELGLLRYDDKSKIFGITDKGYEFLQVFDELNDMVVYNSL